MVVKTRSVPQQVHQRSHDQLGVLLPRCSGEKDQSESDVAGRRQRVSLPEATGDTRGERSAESGGKGLYSRVT